MRDWTWYPCILPPPYISRLPLLGYLSHISQTHFRVVSLFMKAFKHLFQLSHVLISPEVNQGHLGNFMPNIKHFHVWCLEIGTTFGMCSIKHFPELVPVLAFLLPEKISGGYIREFKGGFDLRYELLSAYCWRQNTDLSQLLKAAIGQKRRNYRTVMEYLFHLFMGREATGFDCKEL